MRRSWFLALLFISALLCLSVSHAHGRRVKTLRRSERGLSSEPSHEENSWVGREVVDMVMDYEETGASTNQKNGALFSTPSPASPSRH